jgi:hypothetical protein
MAGGILYLDADDEITTAAARIRDAEGRRVAIVLPYGSRVATSRINFRLLSRDALTHEKRLSIVAGDAATRALAASAGLPVFSSVAEYESSEEAPRPPKGSSTATGAAGAAAATGPDAGGRDATETADQGEPNEAPPEKPARRRRSRAAATAAAAAASANTSAAAEPADPAAHAPDPAEEVVATGLGLAASATVVPPPADPAREATGATTIGRPVPPAPAIDNGRVTGVRPTSEVRVRARPEALGGGGTSRRVPVLAALAVIGLAVVVVGVAAFLVLPSATATVSPRQETIGPINFRVTASTEVSEPRIDDALVPAERIEIPVEAADTFTATGKRTEEEKAKGAVRFDNLDFTSSNTIPKGSVVSTGSGVKFRTDRTIRIPAAELRGLTVIPSRASVKVTAVDAGPEGNVEPNSITTIPRGEEPLFLKVTNPDATSGGTREEFPRVTQEDVDAAVATLGEALTAAFDAALEDPQPSGDATVFSETAELGEPTYSVDPASLVGEEVETFDLGASAVGTVLAVDEAPVRDIAEARLLGSVEAGHELVEGSSSVTVDPAIVNGGTISFPVTVTASQVAILDPAAIEAQILGLPEEDAKAILDGYGTATLDLWPDWAATVPSLDDRVDVIVDGPVVVEQEGSSP